MINKQQGGVGWPFRNFERHESVIRGECVDMKIGFLLILPLSLSVNRSYLNLHKNGDNLCHLRSIAQYSRTNSFFSSFPKSVNNFSAEAEEACDAKHAL